MEESTEKSAEEEERQNSWLVPEPEEMVGSSLALQQLRDEALLPMTQHRSTDRVTYLSLLWQTLCTIPRLVQTQSGPVISLFLQFLATNYPSLYHAEEEDEERSIAEQQLQKVYLGNRKLANNRLMDYLKLFALFNHPASLPSAKILKEVYTR